MEHAIRTSLQPSRVDCLMDLNTGDWNPFDVLLQCQADIEQLQHQVNHITEIINNQGQLLQKISQHMIHIAQALEDCDRRLLQLED
jgi:hypothetical protein